MVFQRYIRYFTEKLNRRNITSDVKHFEDCERLFISIGRCFVVEALLEFFKMADTKQKPSQNAPNSLDEEQKDVYIITAVEKFLDKYVFSITDDDTTGNEAVNDTGDTCLKDGVFAYSVDVMVSFLLLADVKDAVKLATDNIWQYYENSCLYTSQVLLATINLP